MKTPINNKLEPKIDPQYGIMKIGKLTIPPTSIVTALLYGFSNTPYENFKDREYYFWRLCDELWGHDELPEIMMERNPWADKIIKKCIENKFVAIGGAASSSKSHTMAAWSIINFLSNPAETLILVTSTTLREARKRIWGSIISLISVIPENGLFKIRDSIGDISYINEQGNLLERTGISLIAAERSNTREAVGKFIGIKQRNIILVGDELSEISPAVLEAGLSNLNSARDRFTLIGMSNPSSPFDAFGSWAEPKGGWEKVDVLRDTEWETRYGGSYIRLDGENSPNIEAGYDKYPYLTTQRMIDEAKTNLGEKSRGYMRMIRAVFFDAGEDEAIYSDMDIIKWGATRTEVEWASRDNNPKLVAGLDPAFTNGGDNTSLSFGWVGFDINGNYVCKFAGVVNIFDDAGNKTTPRSYQIAEKVMDLCVKNGVSPRHLGVDATGAGEPFCDVLSEVWDPAILRVQFGGRASDARVSAFSKKTGKELFTNRVSELWFVGRELMRTKQFFGLPSSMSQDICGRGYEYKKIDSGLRTVVESKQSFKKRLGRSPDEADSMFLMLDVARQRLGLIADVYKEPNKKGDGEVEFNPQMYRKKPKTFKSLIKARKNENTVLP